MGGASAVQLLELHTDEQWRSKFIDLSDLIDILRDCIIGDDYSIPDDLNESLPLTEAGNRLKSRLIRKEDVPAKEAHLMCALSIGHDELFLDVDAADVGELSGSVSRQIREGHIRFPFIFWRYLYDAFSNQFEDEQDSLTSEETIKLLDAIPSSTWLGLVNGRGDC